MGSLPAFDRLVALGYNSVGSNLALGMFEDFGRPRLHYSGNFWCATRELVASAPQITLGTRTTAGCAAQRRVVAESCSGVAPLQRFFHRC